MSIGTLLLSLLLCVCVCVRVFLCMWLCICMRILGVMCTQEHVYACVAYVDLPVCKFCVLDKDI